MDFSFLIYNRWGQIVWESHDLNAIWDGTYNNAPCQDGTYTWILRFGTPKTDEKKQFTGNLTIIR